MGLLWFYEWSDIIISKTTRKWYCKQQEQYCDRASLPLHAYGSTMLVSIVRLSCLSISIEHCSPRAHFMPRFNIMSFHRPTHAQGGIGALASICRIVSSMLPRMPFFS